MIEFNVTSLVVLYTWIASVVVLMLSLWFLKQSLDINSESKMILKRSQELEDEERIRLENAKGIHERAQQVLDKAEKALKDSKSNEAFRRIVEDVVGERFL